MNRLELKIKAKSYSDKQRRKQILKHLKQIRKAIKERAKFGKMSDSWTFMRQTTNFYELYAAFRLFKLKYKELDVNIRRFYNDEDDDFFELDKIVINIKWN